MHCMTGLAAINHYGASQTTSQTSQKTVQVGNINDDHFVSLMSTFLLQCFAALVKMLFAGRFTDT